MAGVGDPPYCIAATYDATAQRSSAETSSANSGIAVPGVPTAMRRKMSSSDLLPITAGSVRFAGGGPFTDFAFGPSPRPDAPWHAAHRSRETTAPRSSDGGRVGNGSTTLGPPAAAVMNT